MSPIFQKKTMRDKAKAPIDAPDPSRVENYRLKLYELLVLADAIRGGRQREREIAVKEISRRLKDYNDSKS